MRVYKTSELSALENVISATLTETISEGATFELEIYGFGYEAYSEGEGYRIETESGETLFQGYLDSVEQSNEDGAPVTHLTILDEVAQLNKISSQIQEQEIDLVDGEGNTYRGISKTREIAVSVGSAFSNKSVSLHGKTYNISVSEEAAGYNYIKSTGKRYSMLQMLNSVRSAHPDLSILVDGDSIVIGSVNDYGNVVLSADDKALQINSVQPDFESVCGGVIVTAPVSRNSSKYYILYRSPSGVSVNSARVKIFQASSKTREIAVKLAKQYYAAASLLYYNCNVTLPLEQAKGNYLGRNLSLVGTGTNPAWENMKAPISVVEWDFIARQVTISTSNALAEPDIPNDDNSASGGDGAGDSDYVDPNDPYFSSDESSDVSSSSDWSYGSFSLSNLPSWSSSVPFSPDITMSIPWSDLISDFTLSIDFSGSSVPSGASHSGNASQSGNTSQSGDTSQDGSAPVSCDCAEKWNELDTWKADIEKRLEELEEGASGSSSDTGSGSCGCAPEIQEIKDRLTALENVINGLLSSSGSGSASIDESLSEAPGGAGLLGFKTNSGSYVKIANVGYDGIGYIQDSHGICWGEIYAVSADKPGYIRLEIGTDSLQ